MGVLVLIWTLAPLYNMVAVALEKHGNVFSNDVWPKQPSLESFWIVFTQGYWYLADFWRQFGNSLYLCRSDHRSPPRSLPLLLTLLIGSLASFSISRMRIRHGWVLSNAALMTYVIPSSFLAIPFYRIMQNYGLTNNLWSVIAAEVTFATPYAIFIFQQYGVSIPRELDEAARIDGASPVQIYWRIYLPLMAPALVAVGTYALLLAWNEYLYQYLLLSSTRNMTVAVALAQFLNSDQAPWNYMMATAIIYAVPPVAIYYICRRRGAFSASPWAASRRTSSATAFNRAVGWLMVRPTCPGQRSSEAKVSIGRIRAGRTRPAAMAFAAQGSSNIAAWILPGRSPSSSLMRRCSSPSSSTPSPMGYRSPADPSLYVDLVSDPVYARTVVNTLLFVAFGVNVTMFLALLVSGFFMRRGWWIKALLGICLLPWALPSIPAFLAIHWMLIGEYGFLDSALSALFGIDGPIWFNERWLALGSDIVPYIWKWLPFWTLVFLAGRMAIPREIYDAADVDGATGPRRFLHVVYPLLANMYLVCTLLSALWTIRRLQRPSLLVSGGAPLVLPPPKCWRRSASTTPSISVCPRSAWRRSSRPCPC